MSPPGEPKGRDRDRDRVTAGQRRPSSRHSPRGTTLKGVPDIDARSTRGANVDRMLRRQGLGLLLGTVLANVAWAQGSTKFDGQYVGALTLTKIINGDCTRSPPGALYPLTIEGGHVEFKYDPRFDTILRGFVNLDGVLKASAPIRRGRIRMTGHISGNHIIAFIRSPSCKYTFDTKN